MMEFFVDIECCYFFFRKEENLGFIEVEKDCCKCFVELYISMMIFKMIN